MPLQNRVNPWGDILAIAERGTLVGNRGCLHDERRQVRKAWARTAWVTCALEFKSRHRTIMSPGMYTELFFLDEVTALAAGHRPCATCRRADFEAFKSLWLESNPDLAARSGGQPTGIDKLMHAERVDAQRKKVTWQSLLGQLPDGSMVTVPGTRDPLLIWGGKLHRWSPSGYQRFPRLADDSKVDVLTPRSVVNTLRHGYRPVVHRSARADPS